MRSVLTAMIQRTAQLVEQVKSLPPDEYDLFLDMLLPEQEVVNKPKKSRKKRAVATTGKKRGLPMCSVCGNPPSYEDHFQPSPNYHPFGSSAGAQSAAGKSLQKSSMDTSAANTEVETASATAVGASGD